MSGLLEKVSAAIRRERMLSRGERLLVAVSGGCDSVVLLEVLRRLSEAGAWAIEVAHFNHRLRGVAADADERWVGDLVRGLGLPFHSARQDVRAVAASEGVSLEMAARRLRHTFLAETAAARGIGKIALGHQADDQVETLFLRLFRGAAGQGLRGLQWCAPSPADCRIALVRPLLDCARSELLAYAEATGLTWREDATNASLTLLRNRVRHSLLPMIEREFQAAVRPLVRRIMRVAGADADFVAATARGWLAGNGALAFDQLHRAVQRQVVLQQLHRLGFLPTFALVERLIEQPVEPIQADETRRVWREPSGHIVWARGGDDDFSLDRQEIVLRGPSGESRFGGLQLRWQLHNRTEVPRRAAAGPSGEEWFDAAALGVRVTLRHWQPGDRFHPIGALAPAKLQDLFVNAKVARNDRHRRVVAENEAGTIFWVEGLRIGDAAKIGSKTRRTVQWQWNRSEESSGSSDEPPASPRS